MQCRKCNNEIPEGSIFCNWCGEKQLRQRKKREELKVPEPRQLPSGRWTIQLRRERWSTTEDTRELCIAKARAIRAGFLAAEAKKPKKALGKILDEYIDSRNNLLSPSTLRTYRHIRQNRFAELMEKDVGDITLSVLQKAINDEAPKVKPKTLRNAWGLLRSALKGNTAIDLDSVLLPAKAPSEKTAYEAEDLKKLFSVIKDSDIELAVYLAACLGLRRSEILALTPADFDQEAGTVSIGRARVPNENNELVEKGTKTEKSTRTLACPSFIMEKVPFEKEGYLYDGHSQNYILEKLKRICTANGLPDMTLHGLRHTNASVMLALNVPDKYAMERGGWSTNQTMKNIYQHTVDSERKKTDDTVNSYFEKLIK